MVAFDGHPLGPKTRANPQSRVEIEDNVFVYGGHIFHAWSKKNHKPGTKALW